MTIPSREDIRLELLRLTADGGRYSIDEYEALLADRFRLSSLERQTRQPSGRHLLFRNRAEWAAFDLTKAGLLKRPGRGSVCITEEGQRIVRSNPPVIDHRFLLRYPGYSVLSREVRN